MGHRNKLSVLPANNSAIAERLKKQQGTTLLLGDDDTGSKLDALLSYQVSQNMLVSISLIAELLTKLQYLSSVCIMVIGKTKQIGISSSELLLTIIGLNINRHNSAILDCSPD